MKLGGKYTASLNDWKSLSSLRLFKPPCSSPPFLSLFLPFLAVSFLLPFLFNCSSLGQGLTRSSDATGGIKVVSALRSRHCTTGIAAVLWDAGTGLEQPAGITDTEVGWDLESQQLEGHPSCNLQKL